MQGLRAVYPKPGSKGAVEVLPADLARLDEGEFLNDTIIDFWMRCALITFSQFQPQHRLEVLRDGFETCSEAGRHVQCACCKL